MMVSMVIPETGLRAVVAMALAATEVKKNEKSSVSPRPTAEHGPGDRETSEEDRHGDGAQHHAEQDGEHRRCRGRCAPAARGLAMAEGAQRDAEGAGNDAQRFEDAENARRGDGAHADKAHVACDRSAPRSSSRREWWRDRRRVDVAADEPDQRDQNEVGKNAAGAEDHSELRRPIT